jgi:hypothetical protein
LEARTSMVGLAPVLVILAGSALVAVLPRIDRILSRSYVLGSAGFFILTRIVLLVIIMQVSGRATGPDNVCWVLHGQSALAGRIPYVDYHSEYGPAFAYMLVPAFRFLSASIAPAAAFILFDLFTFVLLHWVRVDRVFSRKVATLYLITPISWLMVVRFGQDESIGAFFVVLILILARKGPQVLLPIVAAAATACTKVLFLLPALPVILNSERPVRAVLIMFLAVVVFFAPFLLMGGGIFKWTPPEGQFAGPSIWQALSFRPSLGDYGVRASLAYGRIAHAVSIVTCALLVALVVVRGRRLGIVNGVLVLFAGLMLTTAKAWPHYALLVLPLLCLRVRSFGGRREGLFFAFYGFLLLTYFPNWVGLSAEVLTAKWLAAHASVIAIVGCHIYLLVTSIRPGLRVQNS